MQWNDISWAGGENLDLINCGLTASHKIVSEFNYLCSPNMGKHVIIYPKRFKF
jgi:hypothetical protein